MTQAEYSYLQNVELSNWSCNKCLFPSVLFSPEKETDQVGSMDNSASNEKLTFPKLKKGLTVAHLNINRLLGKMDSVRELLSEFPLDIFTVSDTWLSSHILDEELKIDGYSFVRKDRENTEKTQGGGLIVYVRDGINFSERDNISNGGIEDIWIEVKRDKCKNLLVGSFYRPPDQNLDYFNTSLSESLESLHGNDLSGDVVLLGDFNVDFSKHVKNSTFKRNLCQVFENNDLHQIIRQPTRITINSKTLIDLICVNNPHRFVQTEVLHTSHSDHALVLCVQKVGVPKSSPKYFEARSYKNYFKESFVRYRGH